ncbi:hypothetical protein RBB50_009657 [Rhinocladiella similis]
MAQLDEFDVLVFAAMVPFQDEQQIIQRLLKGFSSKPSRTFVFISGSGVISIPALDGEWSDYAAAEDDPYPFESVLRARKVRLATEDMVVDAADGGFLRTLIIRPPLVWGHGGSIPIPQFFESARTTGTVCYLGQGLNVHSHVHVDDVAAATYLAFERGESGNVYHLVAGEENFRTIAEAVGQVTNCPARSLEYGEAVKLWGATWVETGLAVNSRMRAPKTRSQLCWKPSHVDLIADIR